MTTIIAADDEPTPLRPSATTSGAQLHSASLAARSRLLRHGSSEGSPSPRPPPIPRRRTSILSFSSLEDASRSFTEDFIDPRTASGGRKDDTELTNWHSSPLAFAILPAAAGLLFKNGSAFVTDVLLLGLAAIFMNWSIRLPWDWYYSAQALKHDVEPDYDSIPDQDEAVLETASSTSSSPKPATNGKLDVDTKETPAQDIRKRELATAELRRQELLALGATFLFPILASYLLHVIRAQLSGASGGLVSDYNISIFLLAAEIRPIRQVVRLMSARTLYLQRTINSSDDTFITSYGKGTIDEFNQRIMDIEARMSETINGPPTMNVAQKSDVSDVYADIKKRYEPRLDALDRAVRLYEKRFRTFGQVNDQRLQSLEARIQETLTLAASAAKHSQGRGGFGRFLDTLFAIISLPITLVWIGIVYPFVALENLYNKVKRILLGPMPPRSPKKSSRGRRESASNREDSRNRSQREGSVRKNMR